MEDCGSSEMYNRIIFSFGDRFQVVRQSEIAAKSDWRYMISSRWASDT